MVFLSGDNVRLAADAYGDAAAPAVLFFHGGGQSRRAWRGSAQRVAAAGYRGITVDLRGHGQSEWAADGDYDVRAFGRDVGALIGGLSGPVALVGASRGGQAALLGAAACPDRVPLLMLADTAPLIAKGPVDGIRAFFQASADGFATLEEAAQALATHMGGRSTDPAGLARAMRQDAAGRWFWQWDPRTAAPEFIQPPSEDEAIQAAAAQLRCPVVLVRGELSEFVSDASVARFKELTPQLVVLVAKGEGHMFTGDANDAFATTLIDNLARCMPLDA
jgi:pimeloyl-ACP methyl ester carboxylesterase